jgi:hypothetical protein
MTALRGIERWFHYRVLRHPRYTWWSATWQPLRTTCWCGVEWEGR